MDEDQIIEEQEYILPDDYKEEAEEETTDAEELEESEEQTEETQEENKQKETKDQLKLDEIEVKFLHETKKLKDFSPDELKTLIQKGMNHDRLSEKVNLATEKSEKIKELSQLYNMSESDLIETLFDQYFEAAAERDGKDKNQIKKDFETNKKQASTKMYERFLSKYPTIDPKSIPVEVWEEVNNNGEDLTRAYDDYTKQDAIRSKDAELQTLKNKIAELEAKQKTKEQNETVKQKAVVKSTSGNGKEKSNDDDFLAGLLGE